MTFTAAQTLQAAYADLNIMESPAGSNHVTLHDGTDLWAFIHKQFGIGQEGWPYCDAWVTRILFLAGVVPNPVPAEISVQAQHGWYARKGWLVHDPQPGDLCCFHFSHDDQHTGFVVANLGNGHIKTIEANTSKEGDTGGSQSDGGGIFERTRTINSVDAFCRPPYALAQPSPGPVTSANVVKELKLLDGSGAWDLHADGGVFTVGKAPFYGSYPALPPAQRQGARSFVDIQPRGDGKPGYVLTSNHGEHYVFPV